MKHSPAPWRWIDGDKDDPPILVDANNGDVLAFKGCTYEYSPDPPDAALIAAAPEMYEILKGLEALGNDIAPYWAERIKSAIAKAEGK